MQDDIIGQHHVYKLKEYSPQIQVFCWAEESNNRLSISFLLLYVKKVTGKIYIHIHTHSVVK